MDTSLLQAGQLNLLACIFIIDCSSPLAAANASSRVMCPWPLKVSLNLFLAFLAFWRRALLSPCTWHMTLSVASTVVLASCFTALTVCRTPGRHNALTCWFRKGWVTLGMGRPLIGPQWSGPRGGAPLGPHWEGRAPSHKTFIA